MEALHERTATSAEALGMQQQTAFSSEIVECQTTSERDHMIEWK